MFCLCFHQRRGDSLHGSAFHRRHVCRLVDVFSQSSRAGNDASAGNNIDVTSGCAKAISQVHLKHNVNSAANNMRQLIFSKRSPTSPQRQTQVHRSCIDISWVECTSSHVLSVWLYRGDRCYFGAHIRFSKRSLLRLFVRLTGAASAAAAF